MGIVPVIQALRAARERDLDLVEVAPAAKPPVCRLLNYGKFIYEKAKKEKQARRSQRVVEIKEIRMRPKIGEHDIAFKLRRVREFLGDGAKVRLRVRFRGRERSYPEIGEQLLERLSAQVADVAAVEQAPMIDQGARSVFMMLAPKPSSQRPAEQEAAAANDLSSDGELEVERESLQVEEGEH
jgi:translation initiation factor IF-3